MTPHPLPQVTFPTEETYTEGWQYCMRVGVGFTYCREELWIQPTAEGTPDDWETVSRLEEYAGDDEPHTSMVGGGVGW